MSSIGAVSTIPPNSAMQAIKPPAKPDKVPDEASEPMMAKAAEAASPHRVDIKA